MPLGSSVLQKWRDEIPPGLAWVDGISRRASGWELDVISIGNDAHQKQQMSLAAGLVVPLADTQSRWFQRSPAAMLHVQVPDLAWAETLFDPRDVLQELVAGIRPSRRHAVIQVSEEPRVFVPALLLIRALYGGSRTLNRHLLTPNAPDLLGVVTRAPDAIEINGFPGSWYTTEGGRFARVMAWMHTRLDARKGHASVLDRARQGEIGLSLPSAALSFWAYGFALDSGFLVFEMNAVDVKLPISSAEIVLNAGGISRRFPSYVAQRKSPWSTDYEAPSGSEAKGGKGG